ncbi:MAG: hypothetical protein KBT36_06890 [Kurthia sp.]|nr:hypothetical protein [Candidatus Kurthia equi]
MEKKHIYRVAMSFPMIKHDKKNQTELELIVNEAVSVNNEKSVMYTKYTRTMVNALVSALYVSLFLASSTFYLGPKTQVIFIALALLPVYFISAKNMYRHASWLAFKDEVDHKLYRWEKALAYLKSNLRNTIMQCAITGAFFAISVFILLMAEQSFLWILLFSVGLFTFTSFLSLQARLIGVAIANYSLLKDNDTL